MKISRREFLESLVSSAAMGLAATLPFDLFAQSRQTVMQKYIDDAVRAAEITVKAEALNYPNVKDVKALEIDSSEFRKALEAQYAPFINEIPSVYTIPVKGNPDEIMERVHKEYEKIYSKEVYNKFDMKVLVSVFVENKIRFQKYDPAQTQLIELPNFTEMMNSKTFKINTPEYTIVMPAENKLNIVYGAKSLGDMINDHDIVIKAVVR